jgi:hypothetical protein
MLAQSKSILAKLLATENITVEHRKTVTAYFDTKNRVMVLPMWTVMNWIFLKARRKSILSKHFRV